MPIQTRMHMHMLWHAQGRYCKRAALVNTRITCKVYVLDYGQTTTPQAPKIAQVVVATTFTGEAKAQKGMCHNTSLGLPKEEVVPRAEHRCQCVAAPSAAPGFRSLICNEYPLLPEAFATQLQLGELLANPLGHGNMHVPLGNAAPTQIKQQRPHLDGMAN